MHMHLRAIDYLVLLVLIFLIFLAYRFFIRIDVPTSPPLPPPGPPPPPGKPVAVRFRFFINGKPQPQGPNMTTEIRVDQESNAVAEFVDKFKNVVKPEGPSTWVSSDTSIADLEPGADGTTAKLLPTGVAGPVTITITNGELTATADAVFVGGAPKAAELKLLVGGVEVPLGADGKLPPVKVDAEPSIVASFADEFGNPVTPTDIPTWATSDSSIADIEVSDDGKTIKLVPTGVAGPVTFSVDLNGVTTSITMDFVGGAPVAVTLKIVVAETPAPAPAPAPAAPV